MNEYGLRTAQVAADGETPDGTQKTPLAIVCRSGKDGSASLIYSILGADKMKRFSFADFDGPDAITGNKKLTTIKVLPPGGAVERGHAVDRCDSGRRIKDCGDGTG